MDYIGSKVKLNEWIFDIIKNRIEGKNLIFLDACSGSGAVSKYAAFLGYKVISNDLMKFSSVIVDGCIGLSESQHKQALKEIERLNGLKGIKGYFYKNFCDQSIPPRLYFTESNAKCIDKVRKEINFIKDNKIKNYLLCCGLEAMSRVSNTTGVQAAFLKQYKDRAKEKFILKSVEIISGSAVTYNKDILSLLKDVEFRKCWKEDILYIDPPYNERQYGPNYHLYETFVRNDNPKANGKTGLRDWKNESRSDFCTNRKCLEFLCSIVKETTAEVIFISYNSDGLLKLEDFKKSFKNIIIHERDQKRYKSDTSEDRNYNNDKLTEYIFEIRK